jgi:NitT/TauT family transport system substrate-binding protein
MRLRLYENYRFVLYTPFYAAHAIGAYAAEGLTVELLPSPGVGLAEQALLDGTIWAGPMRVMKHHDDNPGSPLVCFAEIVCRDPFSIIGRRPNPGFQLADLARIRLATVSEVPTPWLCLQEDLRQAGIDPAQLDRVADRSMAENLLALREGRIDAAQLFEPVVEEALASGAGHLWHAASERGRTTYTAFVTTRDRLVGNAEPLLRMVRAIHRTQQWIQACSAAAELAATVSPFFPALASGALTGAIARYQAQGVWGHDPLLPEDGFDRLRNSLVSSGFIRRPASYAACIDNRFARQVLAA